MNLGENMKKMELLVFLYMPFSCAMDWESLKEEFFNAVHAGNVEKIKDFIINKKLM